MPEYRIPAISARHLVRRFGKFVAVDDVSLEVARGEVFGLLGANGAGKTTAIRMLCGTLAPSSGEIAVAGIDMVRHARQARSRIGYVTQRFTLYGDLTVRENLALQAGLYGIADARRGARMDWALDRLDLRAEAGRRAGMLPLGFQRRLAIAGGLLHEPDVLFLDEPTSGIDPLARQHLWELVYELTEAGVGVLVTTHYMDEALFCDRLALMDRGRVAAQGTPRSLLERPLGTPLVELRSAAGADLDAWVVRRVGVREVLPRAGALRVRLDTGADPQAFVDRAVTDGAAAGYAIEGDAHVPPELEDVFVAVLEQAQGAL
jgi:ABC-2 type transport system ATP-binding protein